MIKNKKPWNSVELAHFCLQQAKRNNIPDDMKTMFADELARCETILQQQRGIKRSNIAEGHAQIKRAKINVSDHQDNLDQGLDQSTTPDEESHTQFGFGSR